MDTPTISKPEDILDQWNNRVARVLLPNTIMLFLYIVFGLLGNTAVIYIYKFRFRKPSGDRFFIPYLAFIDSMACVICSSANLIINFNPVSYTDALLCKAFFMLSQFAGSSSALMLTIIAVQRFQRICQPFKPKMTLRTKRLSVLFTLISVLLASTPSVFTTGIAPITDPRLNVTGYVCASVEVMGSRLFPFVYNLLVLTVCVGNLLVLCTLYVMIGKTIYGRVKYRKGVKATAVCESSSSDVISEGYTRKSSTVSETPNSVTPSVSRRKSSRKMKMAGNRLSLMFLVITMVYVVCFVPTLTAIVWDSLDRNVWLTKSNSEVVGFRSAYSLYIINNIVNPIIYGFFDKTFRKEMFAWMSEIC
ncbi:cholecystokinin receptor type A-like [Pecten maximus]|uniref:cholecystokinin receptor type A-like n=1 Tax=Pecten maximus TaxID=6579 RepID=UPI00145834FA|nr:cholecystokinin receptor type A-like [Pecten maximus]